MNEELLLSAYKGEAIFRRHVSECSQFPCRNSSPAKFNSCPLPIATRICPHRRLLLHKTSVRLVCSRVQGKTETKGSGNYLIRKERYTKYSRTVSQAPLPYFQNLVMTKTAKHDITYMRAYEHTQFTQVVCTTVMNIHVQIESSEKGRVDPQVYHYATTCHRRHLCLSPTVNIYDISRCTFL